MNNRLSTIIEYLQTLQNSICDGLQAFEAEQKFIEDVWQRAEGGGGRSRALANGSVFEKGGVNFSHVHGPCPSAIKQQYPHAQTFDACGVSLVIHPHNPFVPIIHLNVRYFQLDTAQAWFGGGIDLTPAYPNYDDIRYFHLELKKISDSIDPAFYKTHKNWADEYFYIKHRQEMRGVGGIFYDYLHPDTNSHSFEKLFLHMQAVGNAFNPIYSHLVTKNKDKPFNHNHKKWQHIRRGRYAEFNLVYDRGTTFGLQTNGRIESILMSLPPQASWIYNHQVLPQSAEAEALSWFQPFDWIQEFEKTI